MKNLFRGYNKLILGFNTFLPESERHKIDLSPDEEAMLEPPVRSLSGNNLDGKIDEPVETIVVPNNVATSNIVQNNNVTPTATENAPELSQTATQTSQGSTDENQSKPPQQMQQQHAITYVTTIRNRFQNEPDIYRFYPTSVLHNHDPTCSDNF